MSDLNEWFSIDYRELEDCRTSGVTSISNNGIAIQQRRPVDPV